MICRKEMGFGVGWILVIATSLGMSDSAAASSRHTTEGAPKEATTLFDPRRPVERELDLSVANGFTLATAGDCIISRPLTQLLEQDEPFAAAVEILRRVDVAFGNLETSILDIRQIEAHPYPGAGDWALTSVPEVARDLKEMGFDLLGRANNHALDWGIEGMRATSEWLDRAGLVHAGVGDSRAAARGAAYLETPNGRVAIVSMASTYRSHSAAVPPHGTAPGRPGLSALRVKRVTVVPAPVVRNLESIERELRGARRNCEPEGETAADIRSGKPGEGPEASPDVDPDDESGDAREISLFGQRFRLGDRPRYTYEVNERDLDEILRSIRLGKQHADFLIATLHAHQTGFDCEEPGDFIPAVARRAIEAGADAFVVHGSHILGPVEIHAGKPIFYALGNFFWSDIQEPLGAAMHEASEDLLARAFDDPSKATDADLAALLNASGFNDERVFQTMVAVSRFEEGAVSEISLYPVDLGYGRVLTKSGMPRLASGEQARTILERVRRMSRNYGTTVKIEGDVGIIHPPRPPRATSHAPQSSHP